MTTTDAFLFYGRYARVAELVFGVHPAGTPGVVDGAARDRRLRQLATTPSAALAQPERFTQVVLDQ